MALKLSKHVLLALLLTSLFANFSSGVAFAQLPFGNLTPTEDTEEEGQEGDIGAPFEEDGPMRPINRPRPAPSTERPQDDDIGFGDNPVQSVEVKERFAGWQGAGDIQGNRISDTLRANWVMLDRNGQFSGSVRGIDDAEVVGMTIFLMNNGRLVKSAAVQEDGTFVFTNVQRGAYSFVGWGDKAFFAFGLNIINENADADPDTPRTVDCLAFQNETTINTDWIQYFAPNIAYRVFGRYSSEEGEDDPDHLYGFEGLTENSVPAVPATSVDGAAVTLDSRGRLVGRVHQMNSINGRPVDLRSTKVMLLKGDDVLGSTTTDNFGIFQFVGVRPGGYGLVAVGVDGVGSVGIEVAEDSDTVLDAEGVAGDGENIPFDFTLVSAETVGWLNHYASEVAYRQALLAPRPMPQQRQQFNDPVCPNCNGAIGPNGCPQCGQRNTAIFSSPCLTYGQWVANGCGSAQRQSPIRRIGDRIRENVEAVDDRFEEVFYGASANSGGGFNNAITGGGVGNTGGGFNNGFAPATQAQPSLQGSGTRAAPPIVQPSAALPMPATRQPLTRQPVAQQPVQRRLR